MKDVKEIYQIPEIENFLNIEFSFGSYDFDDNIRTYSLHDFQSYDLDNITFSLDNDNSYSIEISIISDESIMLDSEKLSDLITQENIQYFSFSIYLINEHEESNRISGFHYRPFLKESEKKY